jgi:MFS family permease
MLAYTNVIDDKDTFLVVSFVSMIIAGVGGALMSVPAMSLMVSHTKKSDREKNFGLLEMSAGLGLLIGPLLGAFLYDIGGFSMPFVTLGK